ncbi:MAG: NgoPII family restriction endonuclease [Clostridia bacterium]|nr:NgoPII family restriction endonuclease [Clostridia bacterium]MDD4386539.1 NgoPII family restriction endonuclease [Clostridia bacterium]
MSNILDAISNLVNNPVYEIQEFYKSHSRANNLGDALEEYIKDLFANTINEENSSVRNEKISEVFSYLGNQNNPPDMIIKNGDAIEVKKIESSLSSIALNSSYPKSKLVSSSPMITNACRNCEEWDEKDIIYTVGVTQNNVLKSLCMVYGMDYGAESEVYEKVKRAIKEGILTIGDVEFSETKELGKVKKVDPLGITDLRIRGMWDIENPMKYFKYVNDASNNLNKFKFMCIINNEKYNSFENTKEFEEGISKINGCKIVDVKIKNPNNPAKLRDAKLITYII